METDCADTLASSESHCSGDAYLADSPTGDVSIASFVSDNGHLDDQPSADYVCVKADDSQLQSVALTYDLDTCARSTDDVDKPQQLECPNADANVLVESDSAIAVSAAIDVNGVISSKADPDDQHGLPVVHAGTLLSTDVDGDVEWRQSNSFESQASSVCSIDTVQSVQRQQPDSCANVTINQEPETDLVSAAAEDGGHDDQSAVAVLQNESTLNIEQRSTPQPEVLEETKSEPPRADFTTGITCCDVPTALDILNTRYRLADVTIHKNMITWSSWNIADMVRGPHRESFWWKGKRRGRYMPPCPETEPADKGVPSQENGVNVSIKDIEVLCEKIELKEKEIELMLQKDEQRQQAAAAAMTLCDETVTAETVPVTCAAPDNDAKKQEGPPPKTKRDNVFQRLLRALRQRFSRQQQPQPEQQQQQPSSSNTQVDQRSGHRRQRTL